MYDLFPLEDVSGPSFFFYLWGASILAYKFIQEPAARIWRRQVSKVEEGESNFFLLPSLHLIKIIFAPPALLAVILIITKIPYSPSPRSTCSLFNATNSTGNYTILEPFARLSDESIDMELNWTIQSDSRMLIIFSDDEKEPFDPFGLNTIGQNVERAIQRQENSLLNDRPRVFDPAPGRNPRPAPSLYPYNSPYDSYQPRYGENLRYRGEY